MNKLSLSTLGPVALTGVLFALLILIGAWFPVRAASPSPSPVSQEIKDDDEEKTSPLDVEAQQTIDEIKKRIEKNRSRVQGTIDELLGKRRGFIGEIRRVTGESITVENGDGTTIIALSESLTLVKDGDALEVDDIAVGNWAIVMGSVQDSTSIEPQFVEVYDETLEPDPKSVTLGTITEISAKEITIVSRSTNEELTFDIVTTTDFQNADGSEIKRTDFEEDMNCLITGSLADETIEALTIRSLAPLDV
ncbi:MAG: hypothetical protein WAU07_05375 [Microgenomates group bacterium]